MNKKIYFAGSIAGGRTDAELYKRLIGYMQKTDIVLTEHIGDLSLNKLEGVADRDRAIYEQDTAWLRESDLVIAECTCPSLGVGYEMAYAQWHGKACHIFYNPDRCRLSAMLKGNGYYFLHPYHSEEEIYPVLDEILNHKEE